MLLTANFALSADGKISTGPHAASGFGSAKDHARLLELRGQADALLVGRGTLIADQMRMSSDDKSPAPARVIAAFSCAPPADHPVFHATGGPVHLFLSATRIPSARQTLGHAAKIHPLSTREEFPAALAILAEEENWHHVHCEGGPTLLRHLLEADVLDRLHITLTKKLFGGVDAPTLLGPSHSPALTASRPFAIESAEFHGDEGFLTYSRRSA